MAGELNRLSVTDYLMPYRGWVYPGAAGISQAERQAAAFAYSGILADIPAEVIDITGLLSVSNSTPIKIVEDSTIILSVGRSGTGYSAMLSSSFWVNQGIEQTTFSGDEMVTITFADSPYDVPAVMKIIRVDCTDGDVVVNFPSGSGATTKLLRVKKIGSDNNLAEYTPQSGETVEGESGSYDSSMPGETMAFISVATDTVTGWERIA